MTRSHLENDGYNLKSSFEKSLKSENKVQGVLTIKFDSSYREKKKEKKTDARKQERFLIVVGYGDK